MRSVEAEWEADRDDEADGNVGIDQRSRGAIAGVIVAVGQLAQVLEQNPKEGQLLIGLIGIVGMVVLVVGPSLAEAAGKSPQFSGAPPAAP
ncbi:MAG TPA: hypothetical protein VGF12_18640 [Roseateles sp.]|uniref:hypothetical protein n=1 Tax=Roseateles sp. TaxID=1971397 RepID=UPI002EDA1C18